MFCLRFVCSAICIWFYGFYVLSNYVMGLRGLFFVGVVCRLLKVVVLWCAGDYLNLVFPSFICK